MKKNLLLTVAGIAALMVAGQVHAETIWTDNFENPNVAGGEVWGAKPDGWVTYQGVDSTGIAGAPGCHGVGGSQLVWVRAKSYGGLMKVLDTRYQANTRYTVSVCVNTGYYWLASSTAWAVDLHAVDDAGNPGWIAFDNGTDHQFETAPGDGHEENIDPDNTNWSRYTFSYTTTADDAAVGKRIGIALMSWGWNRIYADDLSISATPEVPEPGSIVAMLSGLVGLAGYGIRRKK